MQGPPAVYPTAPPGVQVQIPGAAYEGENAGTPGQMRSPLGMIKDKARKMRDKFKKATSPSGASTTHDVGDLNKQSKINARENQNAVFPSQPPQYQFRDNAGGGTDSRDDDEVDHVTMGDDQPKFDQVRSLGEMSKSGEGPEDKFSSGAPAPTVSPGANKSSDGGPEVNSPVSPFKNDGPSGALQAAPTENQYPHDGHHQISTDYLHDPSPGESSPVIEDVTEMSPSVTDKDPGYEQRKSTFSDTPEVQSSSEFPEANAGKGVSYADNERANNQSNSVDSETSSQYEYASPGRMSPTEDDMNVSYPDDLVKPNPKFGRSSSPMHKKVAVVKDDLPVEARANTGLLPDGYSSAQGISDQSIPENAPLAFDSEKLDKDVSSKADPAGFGLLSNEKVTSARQLSVDGNDYQPSPGKDVDGFAEGEGQTGEALVSQVSGTHEADEQGAPYSTSVNTERSLFTSSPEEIAKPAAATAIALEGHEIADGQLQLPESSEKSAASHKSSSLLASEMPSSDTVESLNDSGTQIKGLKEPGVGAAMAAPLVAAGQDDSRSDHDEAGHRMMDEAEEQSGFASGRDSRDYIAEDNRNDQDVDTSDNDSKQSTTYAVADDGQGQLPAEAALDDGGQRATMEDESRGKWEADKLNDDFKGAATPQDTIYNVDDEDLYKPSENKEDEYYDPNNVSDNQFQEGFALGTEEADKEASGTFTGATIEKLSGLTGAVASRLGLANAGSTDAPSENTVDNDVTDDLSNTKDRVEAASSPRMEREKAEQPGKLEGLEDSMAAGVGYYERESPEPSTNALEPAVTPDDDLNMADAQGSQSNTGGYLQSLRNVLSSKLGYGAQETIPSESGHGGGVSGEDENVSEVGESGSDEMGRGLADGAGQTRDEVAAAPSTRGESEKAEQLGKLEGSENYLGIGGYGDEMSSKQSGSPSELAVAPDDDFNKASAQGNQGNTEGVMQSLRNVLSSKLGYGTQDTKPNESAQHDSVRREDENVSESRESGSDKMESSLADGSGQTRDEVAAAPSTRGESDKAEQPGKLEGSENYLGVGGYGDEMSSKQSGSPSELAVAPDDDFNKASAQGNQGNTGGVVQSLRNVLSSKLGYGTQDTIPNESAQHDSVRREDENVSEVGESGSDKTESSLADGSGQTRDEVVAAPSLRGESEKAEQPGKPEGSENYLGVGGYGDEMSSKQSGGSPSELAVATDDDFNKASAQGNQGNTGGAMQGLRNVLSSKLGFGTRDTLPDESAQHDIVRREDENVSESRESGSDKMESSFSDGSGRTRDVVEAGERPRGESEKAEQPGEVEGNENSLVLNNEDKMFSKHSGSPSDLEVAPDDDNLNKADAQGSQRNTGGALQSLRNMFSSKLGYGGQETTPNEVARHDHVSGEDENVSEAGESGSDKMESSLANQQQTGGTLQGLQDTVAAKLGHGGSMQEHKTDTTPRDVSSEEQRSADTVPEDNVDATSEEQPPPSPFNEGESKLDKLHGETSPELPMSSPLEDKAFSATDEQLQTGTFQGLKNAVASKLGYGTSPQSPASEDLPQDGTGYDERPPLSPADDKPPASSDEVKPPPSSHEDVEAKSDHPPHSYSQMFFSTAAAAKDYLWSPRTGAEKPEQVAEEGRNADKVELDSPSVV